MTYTAPDDLWVPQRRGLLETIELLKRKRNVCLFAPTGGGKGRVTVELTSWAMSMGWSTILYLNRRLLIPQVAADFGRANLPYGIRAADYDDYYSFSAPVQIAAADTERVRVLEKNIWPLHKAQLVLIEEVHLQKTGTMKELLRRHKENGALVVGVTATPVGLSDWLDELVISGTLQEYRDCKALVPAITKGIQQPDLSKVKRSVTGEYVIDGEKRRIYTQHIVGRVIEKWKEYNPSAAPTMMFAPGVAESVFLTEQFRKIGVNWAHLDASDAIVDGKRAPLTRPLWHEIMEMYKANDIKGLSSRFRLREGVNLPGTYMTILATPIGSLASYIQSVGRTLRYSPDTPDHVIVNDHGGNFIRHGSVNQDRPWKAWWRLSERVVSEWNYNGIRDKKEPEPICCPRCQGERLRGSKCPHCGLEHAKSQREVIMEDGELRTVDGKLVKPKYASMRPDAERKWEDLYFSWLHSKKARTKSFAQLEGFFVREHGYHPPQDIPYMPKNAEDRFQRIMDVPRSDLISRETAA